MHTAVEALKAYLEEQHLVVYPREENQLWGMTASDHARWEWRAWLGEHDLLMFHHLCPVNVPPARRVAAAEYLTRANYGLCIGGFEMDCSDGEVRYKVSVPVDPDVAPAEGVLEPLVYFGYCQMGHYLPGLLAVAFGQESPLVAIQRIEAPAETEKSEDNGEAGTAPAFPPAPNVRRRLRPRRLQ